MRLFEGLSTTDYQDFLRALGFLIDREGLCNVRIIETEYGILLQASRRAKRGERPHLETFELRENSIKQMLDEAYGRRDTGPLKLTDTTPSG